MTGIKKTIPLVIVFWVFLSAVALGGESPIKLPPSLPGGEKNVDSDCIETNVYEYSDGTKITVKTYAEEKSVARALAILSENGTPVSEDDSPGLHENGAVVKESKDSLELFFQCETHLVIIRTSPDGMKLPDLLKVGDMIRRDFVGRQTLFFSTPAAAFMKLVESLAERDKRALLKCIAPPENVSLTELGENVDKAIIVMSSNRYMWDSRRFDIESKVSNVFEVSENSVMLNVFCTNQARGGFWFSNYIKWKVFLTHLLSLNSRRYDQARKTDFWVPMVKIGNVWKLDAEKLGKTVFFKSEKQFESVKNAYESRQDLTRIGRKLNTLPNNRLPETIEELLKIANIRGDLICPGGTPRPDDHEGFYTNYGYEFYFHAVDDLPPKTVIIYSENCIDDEGETGRMVLFANGQVEKVLEERFKACLDDSRKLSRDRELAKKIFEGERPEYSDEEEATIRKAVVNLGSRDWKERKKARKFLVETGIKVYPILKEYENTPDPEARKTVRELLKHFKH